VSGARGRWFAIAAILLVMTVIHGTVTSGLPAFDKALLAELGVSRGALKLREAIFFLSSGTSGLAVGLLTARFSPRRIILFGLILMAATLLLYSQAQSILQIYFLYPLLGLSYACAHVVVVVLIVRERFTAKRALATSIALSGTSIGAAIYPGVATAMLAQVEWRQALQLLAVLPILVFPLAAWLLRNRDDPLAPATEATARVAGSETTRRTPFRLAMLMIATSGVFFASTSFLMNLFLFLQDSGLSPRMAAAGLSLFFVVGLVGKTLVGLSAERWGVLPVWSSQQAILLAGCVLLTFTGGAGLVLGLMLLGAGWAGCYVLTQVVIADYFAGPLLGRLVGGFILFEAIASGSGVWSAGLLFDRFGSYHVAFAANCLLVAIAMAAGLAFRRAATVRAGVGDQLPVTA
jgi:MFS family permease